MFAPPVFKLAHRVPNGAIFKKHTFNVRVPGLRRTRAKITLLFLADRTTRQHRFESTINSGKFPARKPSD